MKTVPCLHVLVKYFIGSLFVVFLINERLLAKEIKNGYEGELINADKSIWNLNCLLMREIRQGNERNIRKLEKYLRKVKKIKAEYLEYFKKTENLIQEMEIIDPVLFHEINSIEDKKGNLTDIYVKVIPFGKTQVLRGFTNVNHFEDDTNVYSSYYGEKSVSVKISDHPLALLILAHELGHVKYQVPNLAKYEKYYHSTYSCRGIASNPKGHLSTDASGRSADLTVKEFLEKFDALNGHSIALTRRIAAIDKNLKGKD